ncbi:MAG TPA: DNA-binding protein [Firmicutes bacterium]|nr:DNA-binding protein [Bacillota bacterium]
MPIPSQTATFGIDQIIQIKIPKGVDLSCAIQESVEQNNIDSAVILSGIGALKKGVFRNLRVEPKKYPVTNQDRLYLVVKKPLELVSLTGWVAQRTDGKIEVHAHFAASYVEGDTVRTVGGHLTEGTETSIKVIVTLGILKECQKAAVDPLHQQWDLDLE